MSHYTTVETCKVFLQTCSRPIKGFPPRSTSKTTAISLFTVHLCRHVWTLPLFPQTCQQLHLLNRNRTVFSVQRKLLWSLITGKDCETFWKMKRSNKFFIEIHNEFCLIAVNMANMDLTSFNSSRLSCKTRCVTAKARIPRYHRKDSKTQAPPHCSQQAQPRASQCQCRLSPSTHPCGWSLHLCSAGRDVLSID